MRKLLTLVCVLVLAVAAAGCGSSGGSDATGDDTTTTKAESASTTTKADEGAGDGTAEEYAAAFVTSLSTGSVDDGELVLPAAGAECVAPKFVEIMTVEGLKKADISVEDASDTSFDPAEVGMDEAQGEEMIAAFESCDVDIVGLFATSFSNGLTAEQQSCIAENVDPDLTKALLVKTFSTGEADAEFEAVITDLTSSCDLPAN